MKLGAGLPSSCEFHPEEARQPDEVNKTVSITDRFHNSLKVFFFGFSICVSQSRQPTLAARRRPRQFRNPRKRTDFRDDFSTFSLLAVSEVEAWIDPKMLGLRGLGRASLTAGRRGPNFSIFQAPNLPILAVLTVVCVHYTYFRPGKMEEFSTNAFAL